MQSKGTQVELEVLQDQQVNPEMVEQGVQVHPEMRSSEVGVQLELPFYSSVRTAVHAMGMSAVGYRRAARRYKTLSRKAA